MVHSHSEVIPFRMAAYCPSLQESWVLYKNCLLGREVALSKATLLSCGQLATKMVDTGVQMPRALWQLGELSRAMPAPEMIMGLAKISSDFLCPTNFSSLIPHEYWSREHFPINLLQTNLRVLGSVFLGSWTMTISYWWFTDFFHSDMCSFILSILIASYCTNIPQFSYSSLFMDT